jgi:hypothetical protein
MRETPLSIIMPLEYKKGLNIEISTQFSREKRTSQHISEVNNK